jgi:hypothetical protein
MLKIPVQKVIENGPELPDKIRRGLTPKKQHEIMSLAALINAECSAYGITQILDVGAGLVSSDHMVHIFFCLVRGLTEVVSKVMVY